MAKLCPPLPRCCMCIFDTQSDRKAFDAFILHIQLANCSVVNTFLLVVACFFAVTLRRLQTMINELLRLTIARRDLAFGNR